MKPLALAACVTCLLLSVACGEDEASTPAAEGPPGGAATAGTTGGTTDATTGATTGGTQLQGRVGKEGEPDAFSITLTDLAGQPVTTVPAGTYTINVKDMSKIHNFHLTGGSVDEATGVPEIGEKTMQVTLTPGTYTWRCDPHPKKMIGQLTVT